MKSLFLVASIMIMMGEAAIFTKAYTKVVQKVKNSNAFFVSVDPTIQRILDGDAKYQQIFKNKNRS